MTPEQAERIGAELKTRREALGLSLRDAEELSGVADTLIFRLENGKIAKPDADKLARLGAVVGVTLPELLSIAEVANAQDLFPTFSPYLRARYGQLPDEAVAEMSKAFGRIARKYGVDTDGPAPGEDEDDEPQRRRTARK